MDNAYWSVESASWTSTAGALVTPWSDTEMRLRRIDPPRHADEVMRLPSRRVVADGAVPQPHLGAEQPVSP